MQIFDVVLVLYSVIEIVYLGRFVNSPDNLLSQVGEKFQVE